MVATCAQVPGFDQVAIIASGTEAAAPVSSRISCQPIGCLPSSTTFRIVFSSRLFEALIVHGPVAWYAASSAQHASSERSKAVATGTWPHRRRYAQPHRERAPSSPSTVR